MSGCVRALSGLPDGATQVACGDSGHRAASASNHSLGGGSLEHSRLDEEWTDAGRLDAVLALLAHLHANRLVKEEGGRLVEVGRGVPDAGAVGEAWNRHSGETLVEAGSEWPQIVRCEHTLDAQ